jgi:hypothetical protein
MKLIKENQTNWKLQDFLITISKHDLKYEWEIKWCDIKSYTYKQTQIKIIKQMIYEMTKFINFHEICRTLKWLNIRIKATCWTVKTD